MSAPPWHWDGSELTLELYVQPRASKSEVVGLRDSRLRVRVSASPADGQANTELVKLLARELGVGRSRVRIVRGMASRDKRVVVSTPRIPRWLNDMY